MPSSVHCTTSLFDNMRDQHHETVIAATETSPKETAIPAKKSYQHFCGVLAVCAGDGMTEIFRQLGAEVINGGQTMNPSAEDLLKAVEAMDAEQVVILPNNRNIVLTAEQVKHLTERAYHGRSE